MLSETQRTIDGFTRWLDEIVSCGNWKAEATCIAPTYTAHGPGGTQRFTRDEWMAHVLRTRSPAWRLDVHDLVARQDRVGGLFTITSSDTQTGARTTWRGIGVIRFEEGKCAETWTARRLSEYGLWPNSPDTRAAWSVAETDALSREEEAIAAAMTLYQEIRRTNDAERLRELFIDPMVVHGPGATREERLEEFVRRVASEPHDAPGYTTAWHDCFVAGRKALMRWSYVHPHPTPARPSPISGLTLYAFRAGKVVERWQGELPRGTGWA